jgi:23S rRNA (guanosine2251-2'-O)-methyltransferase
MISIALILDNIRSVHNVGSILRSSDGFGVSHVFIAGYTPFPIIPNDERLPHESRKITNAIHKTALGAELTQDFSVHSTTKAAIDIARKQGFYIAAIEQSKNSQPLNAYTPPNKIALVLGNEISGISSDTLTLCNVILEIPMFGAKESFNVSVTAAISLYALRIAGKQA